MFLWHEIAHRRTGHRIPGCFAWHHEGRPLCDHEHTDHEERFTCEDARIEMARIRATPENVDSPTPGGDAW